VITRPTFSSKRAAGFTMIELLVGSAVMLVAVLGALFVYSHSNKVAVEQQMVTEVQNDVRASMFFVTRDLRMAGAGLPEEFAGYFLEGRDNEDQGAEVAPDRVRLMGNIDDPLNLPVRNYQESSGFVNVQDFSFEQYPYPDAYYHNKYVLILPNPESGCRAGDVRVVTALPGHTGGLNESLNLADPDLAVALPGGLSVGCLSPNNYDGGTVSFINVKEYWLDVTGHYPGLDPGVNGYIGGGEGGVLYVTHNGIHFPLARNIENFQVEYNGDYNLPIDLLLDGWTPWDSTWTPEQVARIQQVRIWVLGRTAQAFTSVGRTVPGGIHTYRRPALSNSPAAAADDRHRRFLLDSTSNVRNMSLNLYNLGQR
jgi:hypothetical protein